MENVRALVYVMDRLKAPPPVAGGRAYLPDHAPAGVADPYLVIQDVTAFQHRSLGGYIPQADVTVQITAWGKNRPLADLEAVMDIVHARLHKTAGTVPQAGIRFCLRERIVPRPPEREGDAVWDQLLAEYRLGVQAVAA